MSVKQTPTNNHSKFMQSYVYPDLNQWDRVYVRCDHVKRAWVRLYFIFYQYWNDTKSTSLYPVMANRTASPLTISSLAKLWRLRHEWWVVNFLTHLLRLHSAHWRQINYLASTDVLYIYSFVVCNLTFLSTWLISLVTTAQCNIQ